MKSLRFDCVNNFFFINSLKYERLKNKKEKKLKKTKLRPGGDS